ncbi:MAG: hypothetical protein ACE5JM_12580, partial [Armatimonadota bacterium]
MKGRACLLICVLILGAAVSISAQRLVEIGGPLTPAATARSENFEREPLQGWELAGNARVGRAGQSRGLVCAGGGHGLWVGVSARDFV